MRLKSRLFPALLLLSTAAGSIFVLQARAGDAPASRQTTEKAALDRLFAADQGETRAVLVLRDGKPVYERFAPGYSDANRFISWSMAKTVTAVLVGELVADGRLTLDAPVPFAEWQKPGDPRAKITLRQMLHMSSGIAHVEVGDPLYASDTNQVLFVSGTGNMAEEALARPLEAPPGRQYEYSSLTSLLLSELITRQLTDSRDPAIRATAYRKFAEDRLLRPAGISGAVFDFDGSGTQVGGSIIYMSLKDWGRFGQLLLTGRGIDGSAVIAPEWLAFLRTPSATDPGYGGHVWLNRPRSAENARYPALFPGKGSASAFAAVGHLGQYVIVSPDDGLVLVRLGKTQDDALQPVRDALGDAMSALGQVQAAPPGAS